MPYTNPEFELLSSAERHQQIDLLQPLRMEHARELYIAGTVGRIITSRIASNRSRETMPPSEATEVLPFRESAWNMAPSAMAMLLMDVGGPVAVPTAQSLEDRRAGNHVFRLQRFDWLENMRVSLGSYTAGLVLSPSFANQQHMYSRYLPVMDVTEDDLVLMERQMDEVASFVMMHELTGIDPVTLRAGKGELQMAGEQ